MADIVEAPEVLIGRIIAGWPYHEQREHAQTALEELIRQRDSAQAVLVPAASDPGDECQCGFC